VVIVVRDHYSSTPRTVQAVIATVDPSVSITLVPGATPPKMISELHALAPGRLRLIGPRHHLIPNAARQLALEQASAPYVAFVDNDVVLEPGWLEALVRTATDHNATAARPLILQRFGTDTHLTIHESGGDCEIVAGPRGRSLIEQHRHMNEPLNAAKDLRCETVALLEFHCVLFDRSKLLAIGGFDRTIESQGEHLDVSLRIAEHAGSIWLVPEALATVEFRHGLRAMDTTLYLGRWSSRLNRRSQAAFNSKWGITNPHDSPSTWAFAKHSRSLAWIPLARAAHCVIRRSSPSGLAHRFDRLIGRHLADAIIATGPGWKSWRRSQRQLDREGRHFHPQRGQ
jgi:GT2 family glycosyltransferase